MVLAGAGWWPAHAMDKAETDKAEKASVLPEVRFTYHASQGAAPEFKNMADVKAKKAAFFNYLLPAVRAHNTHIRTLRTWIGQLHIRRDGLTEDERAWLVLLAQTYLLDETLTDGDAFWQTLYLHVDTVPASLALAQAANESAYGTSRFATEGNNFFGQWCLQRGCGLVPLKRTGGANHEVAVFDSYAASVGSYIHNINTNAAYAGFRKKRQAMRQQQLVLNSVELARGLKDYSALGDEYIQFITKLIVKNNLQAYDYAQPLAY